MKTLDLVLKGKWFDMIASGIKKEEYRAIKPFWIKRLVALLSEMEMGEWEEFCHEFADPTLRHKDAQDCMDYYGTKFKQYDYVQFRRGYATNAPRLLLACKGIDVGEAKGEWSDNWQGLVFRIQLGEPIVA